MRNYLVGSMLLLLGTLCAGLMMPSASAQQALNQTVFGVGERLVFDVGFGFITAGEAVMSIPSIENVSGKDCYKVMFTVKSTPTFSFFFEVNDRYETYLDVAGIFPRRFEQHIKEGSYRRDFSAQFDQEKLLARTTGGDFPIPRYVHDIMSAFYYARTIDYSKWRIGEKIPLQNFYKDKTFPLDVKLLGRQKIEVDAGTFNCIIVEPMVREGGLFKSEGRILIWLSDDDLKIPVKVSTKVAIGSIDSELREYSGLRGELKAKVK
ncbi:MAG: DUF3108 domain-containing protein [Ignavibacteriales bacterium]|nr:DUF3108 domain-containing protein [Ignavibacteriales bacterium]